MSGLKTQIEIGADASGVEAGVNQAKRSLAGLGQAASAAGKAGFDGLGQIGTGADASSKSVERATKSMISQIQRAQLDIATAGKSMSEALQIKADFKGVDTSTIAPYIAQLKAAEKAQEALRKSQGNLGVSAAQTAAAMRGVPAQMTDIITSLQGGQAPMTVLLQQGGQLKDMFGGAGNAARALGTYMAGLAMNPFLLATAGAAALGYAAYSASRDARDLRDAVTLTGGAAGVTAGQLQSMAGQVGLNATALAEFAKSGAVGADSMERITLAAIRFERMGGAAVSETVKQFEALKKTPVEASIALNEKTNYLTASIYSQIKALEEQGRHLDAVALAQDAYSKAQAKMADGVEAGLGPVDRMWLSIRQNAEAALKAAKGFVGSEVPLPDRVASQKKVVDRLQSIVDAPPSLTTNYSDLPAVREQLKLEKQRLFILQSSASVEAGTAADRAKDNEIKKAKMAWSDLLGANRPNLVSTPDLPSKKDTEALAVYNRGVAAGAPPEEIQSQVALIMQKYDTGASIAAVKQAEDTKLAIIARAQDDANTLRSTGGLTEIGLIKRTTELTVGSIDARIGALQQERKIVAGRQDSEKEVIALDTQIAQLANQRVTEQVKGVNAVEAAWSAQKRAIDGVRFAMEQEDANALAAEHVRLTAIEKQLARSFEEAGESLKGANRQMALEASMVGATDQVRTVSLEKLRIQFDLEKKLRELRDTDFKTAKDRSDAETQARAQAAEAAAQVETRITTQYWLSAVSEIQNALTDGIINGIENGGVQGAIRGFRDALVNEFKNLVLRPTISAIMSPVAQGVAGAFGISPNGSPANGLGTNTLSQISGVSSVYNAVSGGMAGVGANIAGVGNLVGSANIASYGLGMGMSTSAAAAAAEAYTAAAAVEGTSAALAATYTETAAALTSGASATGTLSSALAAVPVWGWVALALSTQLGGPQIDKIGDGLSGTLSAKGSSVQKRTDYKEDHHGLFGIGAFTTLNSEYSAADANTTNYINAAVMTVTAATKGYAAAIGLSADAVDSFSKQIDLSLTGMNAEQAKAAIDKAISGFVDDMVSSAYSGALSGIAKQGETSSTTLQRLATELTSVNGVFDSMGLSLMAVSVSGATASDALVNLMGGLDSFKAQSADYYKNFYSTDEQKASTVKQINTALTGTGFDAATASRADFRKLVEAQDRTTESGRKMYAALMGVEGAFASITPAAKDAATVVSDIAAAHKEAANAAYSSLVASINAEKTRSTLVRDLAKEQVSAIKGVFDTLKSNVSALYGSVDSTAAMQAQQGSDFITKALAAAQTTGYLPDQTQLSDAISGARGGVDAAIYASQQDADFARLELAGRLDQLKVISGDQLSNAQKSLNIAQGQLDALDLLATSAKAQLDASLGLNVMIQSLGEAMGYFEKAIGDLGGKPGTSTGKTATDTAVSFGGGGGAIDYGTDPKYSQKFNVAGFGVVSNYITDPNEVARLDSINAYINSVGVASQDDIQTIYKTALEYGVSQQDIANATGYLLDDINKLFSGAGVPAFAVGTNYVPRDMLAQIHEGEAIVPKAYNPAAGGGMGGNTQRLEALVEALTAEVIQLRGQVSTTNEHASRTANAVEGNQSRPLLVEIAA